ncbi:MAG: hypothetical protein ACHQ0J_05370 [Candidatus Dormibacterales bacterium]
MLVLFPAILFQIIALGAPSAVAYFGARDDGDHRASGATIVKVAGLQAVGCFVAHLTLLLIYLPHVPATIYPAAVVSLVIAPLGLAIEYCVAALQAARRYTLVNICRPIPTIATIPAALAAWIFFPREILAAVAAIVFGQIIGCAVTAFHAVAAYESFRPQAKADSASSANLLSYGVRSYVASVYPIDAFRIDQLLLAAWTTPAALATYVVASSFTNFPRFLAQSVGYVTLPSVAAAQIDHRRRLQVGIVLVVGAAIILVSIPVFVLMPTLIVFFFGTVYRSAADAGRLLLLAAVLLAIRRIAVDALKGSARMGPSIVAEVSTWLALALLARRWVAMNGIDGMAQSLIAAYFGALAVLIILAWLVPSNRPSAVPSPP